MSLAAITRSDFEELFRQVVHLPELDRVLHAGLPAPSAPEVLRARAALDDPHDFDVALGPVVASLDSPTRRVQLARAVLDLAAIGRIDADVAAVAMIDLTLTDSALFVSSVAEAVGVGGSEVRASTGLVLAAR